MADRAASLPLYRRLARGIRKIAGDRRGAVMPMMVVGMVTGIASIGAAFDLTRVYVVRSQLQSGVDAAALAGARSFGNTGTTDAGRDRQVAIYFGQNFSNGFLGMPAIAPAKSFQTVSGINRTTVSVDTSVRLTFMSLFGFAAQNVRVSATAELQPRPLEVEVVLDDTGSMKGTDVKPTRMKALQAAMKTFINTLHQGADRRPELALGIVTYNVTTNVGALLREAGVPIQTIDGFTNVGKYTGTGSDWPGNPLGWKGCVENDATVVDVSPQTNDFPAGAWDVSKSLPGETVNGVTHPAIRPYLYMPNSTTTGSADYTTTQTLVASYKPKHAQSVYTDDGRTNNQYRLGPKAEKGTTGQTMANTAAYRRFFYDYYIGLNKTNADPSDDVIVSTADGYYAPPTVYSDTGWKVNYSRVPFVDDDTAWAAANAKYGYPIANGYRDAGYNLNMATPNWQCPEPALKMTYGRNKSEYLDYIDKENYPVMPASGTLHHIGFLWGYRLLTRSDRFIRTNPIPSEQPLRALIFMTDGQTASSSAKNWHGAYGAYREKRISSKDGNFDAQVMNRFAKVCQRAKDDGITVYIVSLVQTQSQFTACAGARYYFTTDSTTINNAFNEIAVDLVDLHLTR